MSQPDTCWILLQRDYNLEATQLPLARQQTTDHPLSRFVASKPSTNNNASTSNDDHHRNTQTAKSGDCDDDPLYTRAVVHDDPLSGLLVDPKLDKVVVDDATKHTTQHPVLGPIIDAVEDAIQDSILHKRFFQAGLQVPQQMAKIISSTVLDDDAAATSQSKEENRSISMSTAQARLQRLESRSKQKDKVNIVTIERDDFEARIAKIVQLTSQHWKKQTKESMIKSLRVVTESLSMLRCGTVPRQYSFIWAHLSKLASTFGDLVCQRIQEKSHNGRSRKVAAEICRNWFSQVGCIRNLVPRLYLEIALLPCWVYASAGVSDCTDLLQRISCSIRGVADPLIAAFCRAFLVQGCCRLFSQVDFASSISRAAFNFLFVSFDDLLMVVSEFESSGKQSRFLLDFGLSKLEFERLFEFPVGVLMRGLGAFANHQDFHWVMDECQRYAKSSAYIVQLALGSFPPRLYASEWATILDRLCEFETSLEQKALMCAKLGDGIRVAHPIKDEQAMLKLLSAVWDIVGSVEQLEVYACCAVAYVRLSLEIGSSKQVIVLLQDVLNHLRPTGGAGVDRIEAELEQICSAVCEDYNKNKAVFTSEPFMSLMNMFKTKEKTALFEKLLVSFGAAPGRTHDPLVIHTMFQVAHDLHDSVDALTNSDRRRLVGNLVCKFINKIDFGRDVEQQFKTYVACRGAFSNLDSVKSRLVGAVATLATKTHRMTRGKRNRSVAMFVKSCLAYCHITIPSISDPVTRFQQHLNCGQVALMNNCLPQADTFFLAAINGLDDAQSFASNTRQGLSVREVQRERASNEAYLLSLVLSLCATMLLLPSRSAADPYHLVKALHKRIGAFPWTREFGSKPTAMMGVASVVAALGQQHFIYTMPGVRSNNVLFGGDQRYAQETLELFNVTVERILQELAMLGEAATTRQIQNMLVLRIANQLIVSSKLEDKKARRTLHKLLLLSAKLCSSEKRPQNKFHLRNTLRFIHFLADTPREQLGDDRAAQQDVYKDFSSAFK